MCPRSYNDVLYVHFFFNNNKVLLHLSIVGCDVARFSCPRYYTLFSLIEITQQFMHVACSFVHSSLIYLREKGRERERDNN